MLYRSQPRKRALVPEQTAFCELRAVLLVPDLRTMDTLTAFGLVEFTRTVVYLNRWRKLRPDQPV